ncbi:aldose 1-epimerase [Rhodobacteraceae bacterium CCMM004]|nr:aldose 1-epimerase [Rhodobacteraceae bacterium CCMM004]
MTESEQVSLASGGLEATVSVRGGAVLRCTWHGVPVLRGAPDGAAPGDTGCFPLVPFGNRVRGNVFRFAGRDYRLHPNTPGDPHYLHGEGWRSTWDLGPVTRSSVVLRHTHDGTAIPYVYAAEQRVSVAQDALSLTLGVANTGPRPMPFGIGLHPYFPLTPDLRLQTVAGRMRDEAPGWLPGPPVATPRDLDFRTAARFPDRWVNNGFEDWSGRARIVWPERDVALKIRADSVFATMQLYSPGRGGTEDHMALEPMSHLADAHNMADLGGLRVLAPGEGMSGTVRFALSRPGEGR